MLFPHNKNPHFMLAVDNIVYEIGHLEELRNKNEEQKSEIEWQVTIVDTLIRAIIASRGI
jgi:hypothetical protein